MNSVTPVSIQQGLAVERRFAARNALFVAVGGQLDHRAARCSAAGARRCPERVRASTLPQRLVEHLADRAASRASPSGCRPGRSDRAGGQPRPRPRTARAAGSDPPRRSGALRRSSGRRLVAAQVADRRRCRRCWSWQPSDGRAASLPRRSSAGRWTATVDASCAVSTCSLDGVWRALSCGLSSPSRAGRARPCRSRSSRSACPRRSRAWQTQ